MFPGFFFVVLQQHPNVSIPFSTVFPGSRIPDWFKHRSEGNEINIKVPPNWRSGCNFLGFALSAVIAPKKKFLTGVWFTYCDFLSCESESNRVCSFVDYHTLQLQSTTIGSDHLWLAFIPSIFGFNGEKWSRIRFSFYTNRSSCVDVKGCGIRPLYIESRGDSDGDCCYSDGEHDSDDDLPDLGLGDTKASGCDQERLPIRPEPRLFQDLRQWRSVSEDTIDWRRSQEWGGRQPNPNPYISSNGIGFWAFIPVFTLLFLAHIFYLAPFRVPQFLGSPSWISPFLAAPFRTSTLLLGVVLLLFILSSL